MRQTQTGNNGKRKECPACGAGSWLKDHNSGQFSGPWHFQDCPSVPGGAELTVANIEEKERWLNEKVVPKKQAARILEAVMLMMVSPSREIMLQRKAAIQGEIEKL